MSIPRYPKYKDSGVAVKVAGIFQMPSAMQFPASTYIAKAAAVPAVLEDSY